MSTTAEYMNKQARELRENPNAIDDRLAADFKAMFGIGPTFRPLAPQPLTPEPSSSDASPIVAAAGFSSEESP